MPVIVFVVLLFLSNLFCPPAGLAAPGAGNQIEELQYRLNLGIIHDVARLNLRLTELGPGHYRAEFTGATQGAGALLRRWLPERYETEMTLAAGRLKPLVYREEFQSGGHQVCKEYRFDYGHRLLSAWRSQDHQEMVKKWQVPLLGAVYDPLTFFYNLRLGAYGPLSGGQTLKLSLIPAPEPREMVVRLGAKTPQGEKIMLEVAGGGEAPGPPYYLFCTPQGLPRQVQTRVLGFGMLSGELLEPENASGDCFHLAGADYSQITPNEKENECRN
ncbi:MAG: DUF3108 domain-containing protein [Desulfobaccales bacterium]